MSFRVATATYSDSKEEVILTFTEKFELSDWLTKLDCLKDLLSEIEYRYNQELDSLDKKERLKAMLLGYKNVET